MTLYAIQRFQGVLPLNPLGRDAVAPDLAFNTAISFITNANWQAYAGETTMSHFTQMAGLTTHNFLDTAVAMALALGLTRALARGESETIGNFWVDMTRATLYVLLPISSWSRLFSSRSAFPRRCKDRSRRRRSKAQSRRSPLDRWRARRRSSCLETMAADFSTPIRPILSKTRTHGRICSSVGPAHSSRRVRLHFWPHGGRPRQGRGLLAAMAVIFVVSLTMLYRAEANGNPLLTVIGVDPSAGNLEGKDLRFSQASAALFAVATTGTGTGAANATFDSLTPIGGLVAMFNLLMGCIAPGGVGTGLYGIVLLAMLSVFIAGLMVGRTPEYLGKKIEAREMKFAILALFLAPALVLGFAAVSVSLKIALDSLGNAGPHGLSEILYAYASTASDNGSAFGGLSVNTVWFNTTTGIVMLLGRVAGVVPIMAIAGSLAQKKKVRPSAGTFPTHGPLFVILLLAVVLIVTLLQFFPVITLGPLVEHVLMMTGRTF